jgi:RimJ/RimL family protein N-acetyltransferase
MNMRVLNETDAAAFQTVRLRSLREHPESFGASWEDEQSRSTEDVAAQLRDDPPNTCTLGAFVGHVLVGIVSLNRFVRPKVRHKAILGGMYVAPEARGNGIGAALLDAALVHARAMDGVRDVSLAVTVGNETARNVYLAAGFVPWGVEPRYINVDGQFFDIEWMMLHLP